MRKLTVTLLASSVLLGGIGAGSAFAAVGPAQHSRPAVSAASTDRVSRERHRELRTTADRQSRDRRSTERSHQRADRAAGGHETERR
jgi:hypothetical protein